MSDEEYGITSKTLDYLEKSIGLDFLSELHEKYPNIDNETHPEENRKFWNEIAQKKGFKNHKEWMESDDSDEG